MTDGAISVLLVVIIDVAFYLLLYALIVAIQYYSNGWHLL